MVEYLYWVDEKDNVLGKIERQLAHSEKKIFRTVFIFIFNSKGRLATQKRSMSKDIYPGRYTASASGHVTYGKSYDEIAKSEVEEELGLKDIKLIKVGKLLSRTEQVSEMVMLYVARHDGPFNFNTEEITAVQFLSMEEIRERIKKAPDQFSPHFIHAFNFFLKQKVPIVP